MRPEVALIFGGSEEVFEEYAHAKKLCADAGLATVTIACNSAIGEVPDFVEFGVTLHPDELKAWIDKRAANGFNRIETIWAHRPAPNVTGYTRDWGGSVSLMAAKVARLEDFTHVILCGCPMTVENGHFLRKKRWNAAHAFRKGWGHRRRELPALCLRSMSGWTRDLLGFPDPEWLKSIIDIPRFRHTPPSLKA